MKFYLSSHSHNTKDFTNNSEKWAKFTEKEIDDDINNLLGFDYADCPRYRNITINDSGKVVIEGRCGGGNYKEFKYEIKQFRKHKSFYHSKEDHYDCTYMKFYFKVDDVSVFMKKYHELLQE